MNKYNLKITIKQPEEMINLGYILAGYCYPNLVIALTGDLGAGKTTFTKGIGKILGIKKIINSPTFVIMKNYECENKINGIDKLFHLDVYRLSDAKSDFELEEYFELDGLTIIEWADIINEILPSNLWKMNISDLGSNKRMVSLDFEVAEDNYKNLLNELKGENYEIIY